MSSCVHTSVAKRQLLYSIRMEDIILNNAVKCYSVLCKSWVLWEKRLRELDALIAHKYVDDFSSRNNRGKFRI